MFNFKKNIIRKELIAKQKQINMLKLFQKDETKHPDPLSLLPEIFQPRHEVEDQNTKAIAIFIENLNKKIVAFHIVYEDEIVPFFPKIDAEYRQVRKKIWGRETDVESIVIIDYIIKTTFYPYSNGVFNTYYSNFHNLLIEPFRKKLYSITWNHMMTHYEFNNFFQQFIQVKPEIIYGTREDAGKY